MTNYSQRTVLLFRKQTPTQSCMDPLALRCGEPALKQLLAVVYNTRHDTYLRISPAKYVYLLLCCSHLFLTSLGITDGLRCFAAAGFKALGQTVLHVKATPPSKDAISEWALGRLGEICPLNDWGFAAINTSTVAPSNKYMINFTTSQKSWITQKTRCDKPSCKLDNRVDSIIINGRAKVYK